MHMDRPWDRSSPEPKPLGMQMDCTVLGIGPVSRSHNFEGYTAAFGPAVVEATEHSVGDCTSEAAGIGQCVTMRTKSLVASRCCYSGILPATAAPDRRSAAGCMVADQDTAAEAEAAAVPAELRILRSALAGIDCIDPGSD
jgi:hypothetical protein